MKKIILWSITYLTLVNCATRQAQIINSELNLPSNKSTIPTMLEQAIQGVVTIAIFETEKRDKSFGFGTKAPSPADIAFKKALDLSGAEGSGSGFIINHQGKKYVITNAHVIERASDDRGAIRCYSTTREEYRMKLIGGDTFYDIAVLAFEEKMPGPEIKTMRFAATEAHLGETVYAIGNPLGTYPYSVTQGIVGGKNRLYSADSFVGGKFGFLQHSASVIWGNSGGPLVDSNGRVVGVNSWIEIKRSQVISQLNFAVDLFVLKIIVPEIIEKSRVQRAYLGLEFAVTKDDFFGYGTPVIQSVAKSSPAYKHLYTKTNEEVKAINEEPIKSLEDILMILEFVRAGDVVDIQLADGSTHQITATTLTNEHLNSLAHTFFDAYTDYKISDGIGYVRLNASSKEAEMGNYEEDATYKTSQGQSIYRLIGAGEAGGLFGGGQQFRVQNIADFGRILRLSSLGGHFDGFIMDEDGNTDEICWKMKDADNRNIKALFY